MKHLSLFLLILLLSCIPYANITHAPLSKLYHTTTTRSNINHHCGFHTPPSFISTAELTNSVEITPDPPKKWKEIEWTPTRKLRWDDFQARPNYWSNYSAVTSTYIEETHGCNDYGDFAFIVKAVFVKNMSWARGRLSKDLLRHEQIHFDITEYHARLMRKYFEDLKYPCYREDDISKAVDRIFDAMEKAQHRYDDETYHGLYKNRQAEWESYVAEQLETLSAYKIN